MLPVYTDKILALMSDVLEVETDTIRMEQTLDELEVDSIVFIRLVVQCETVLSMQFEDEMLLISRFPTVQVFVDYVNGRLSGLPDQGNT